MKKMILLIFQERKRVKIKQILQKITFLNEPYTRWKWRERKVSWGAENPDKIFFVVRRATSKVGLFSLVMTNMGLVRYALEQGYIPVIDMQSNQNTYLEDSQVGKVNAWEFYFEQPCGYSLEDIQRSKNIILSDGIITDRNIFPTYKTVKDENQLLDWKAFFKKYLRVKTDILEEMEDLKKKLFAGKKTLGVLCRGTDYTEQHPKNHPIQPEVTELISKVKRTMQEQNCECIYLATEDEAAYQQFEKSFGSMLRVTEAKRCKNVGNVNINDISYERDHDRYLKGREYLMNILLLAECDCLVAGSAGGTNAALLLNQKYDYKYVFDLGVY